MTTIQYYKGFGKSHTLIEMPSGCIANVKGRILRKPNVTFRNCSLEEMNFITNQINNNERYYNPKIRNLGIDVKETLPHIQTGAAIGSLALTTLL